jgi:hypothetical protein
MATAPEISLAAMAGKKAVMQEMRYLQAKWGSHVKIGRTRGKEKISINIQRKEQIHLT